MTNFAKHSQKFNHDQLNRLLCDVKLTPRLVWEQTKAQIIAAGMDDYISKPVRQEELGVTIEKLLADVDKAMGVMNATLQPV